ncbi:MAG: two-component sensor histidine kinase [Nocardioides sp.]|nr:two-component sensor histidine kinase [Nocardioides sp.]
MDGTDVLVEARPSASGGAVVLVADTADVASTVDVVRRRVLVAIGVGLLASIGLAALLARRLGRPLRRLADAAHRLGEGERDVPVPDDGPDEVAEVSRALRALDRALATSEGRQREFLLSVSHELRTPLTAVRGYAEALADGVVPPEETGEVARTVLSETERLERYVADLLALARMQAEDFAVEPVPVDVIELLGAAARAWEEPGRRRGVTVGCAPLGTGVPVPELSTDPVRLRQVVDALVDNAVRVCGDGDRVVLEVVAEPGAVRVEVRDSGPGLTADDARVAFEPGVLHDRYAGRRPGGHGLGLAIVHRLVTRLGGTVEVGAAPEGGAAFVVRLPV